MPNGWPQDVVGGVAVTVPVAPLGLRPGRCTRPPPSASPPSRRGWAAECRTVSQKDLTGLWIKKPDFPDLVGTHTQVRGPVSERSPTMPECRPRHVAVGVAVPMPGRIDGGDGR
jgi:hypothetical protein